MTFFLLRMIGNVGKDPEMDRLKDGRSICTFSVAVNRRWNNQRGEKMEETTWYRVSALGNLAEEVFPTIHKGIQVLVVCDQIKPSMYTRGDGSKGVNLDVRAKEVIPLGGGHAGYTSSDYVDAVDVWS